MKLVKLKIEGRDIPVLAVEQCSPQKMESQAVDSEPGVNGTWMDWFSRREFEHHGCVTVNERLIKIRSAKRTLSFVMAAESQTAL